MSLTYTPVSDIPKIVQGLRSAFNAGITRSLDYRKTQLRAMYNMISENDAAIREAVFQDLHKPPAELMIGESGMNLDKWAANRSVKTGIVNKFDNVHIRKDPLGMVLIIGAWNYPLNLLLAPAVGAIAAGNTVLLKPSEVAPHTAALLTKLLPAYLDQRAYRIVNGAAPETTLLLEHKFDHIFYTGSGQVGRIIMGAAAKQLTPVTLELGGKSPAFISRDVDIAITARRLAFGKFFNCGQTCIAPDYLIVERGIEDKLIEAFKASILEFYGTSVQSSNSYGRIVNKSHFQRLKGLLDETKGKIVAGGELDEDNLFISPTLVLGVDKDDKLMEGEIFGPILPLMVVDRLVEGVKYVNQGDQPLALYVFSKNKKAIDYILDHTRSGGVVVNDALVHFIVSNLPFGGTGPSGIGNYHGKRSFDVFSHERSALIKSMGMEKLNDLRYPPYSEKKTRWLDWFLFDKASFGGKAAVDAPPSNTHSSNSSTVNGASSISSNPNGRTSSPALPENQHRKAAAKSENGNISHAPEASTATATTAV
ncbi:aldehyde dehydrogenase 3, member A2 [Linnemannia elongata]|nr:aldehyde dehydrogenase 3, member A2 [Linnemannia elongata]